MKGKEPHHGWYSNSDPHFFSFTAIFHAFFHAVFSVNAGNRTHICQEYAGKWQGRHIFPHFRAKNMIFQWFNLFFTRGKMINFIWIYLYTFYWGKIDILQIISYFLWDYGLGTYYRCRIYTDFYPAIILFLSSEEYGKWWGLHG